MKFSSAREIYDVAKVGGIDSCSGDDLDPAICGLYEPGDGGGAFECGTLAAGSENTGGSGGDDGFERREEIGSFIESAMKGDGKRASEFDENAGLFDVDRAVRAEDTQNQAVHATSLGENNLGAHVCEFGSGIDEVFGSRANHGEDGELCAGSSVTHEFFGRRKAADGEVFAEFYAIGPALFGGDSVIERLNRDFEEVL